METNTLGLGIKELCSTIPIKVPDTLSDDFFIAEIKDLETINKFREPHRFNGFLILYCVEGNLQIEVNLIRFDVPEGAILLTSPDNIICNVSDPSGKCTFVAMAASRDFLSRGRMDFSRLFNESLNLFQAPCIHPDQEDVALLDRYLRLIYHLSAHSGGEGISDAVSSAVISVFYFLGAIWQKYLLDAQGRTKTAPSTPRSRRVFETFIKLVGEYHTVERGMSFYADKMGLTPKYLSKQIKQLTGRSGPDWIDSFVIVEAKNLLKYSDLPVKEIVKKLNFTNSSVFHKFFKAHTEMTPSEYRR